MKINCTKANRGILRMASAHRDRAELHCSYLQECCWRSCLCRAAAFAQTSFHPSLFNLDYGTSLIEIDLCLSIDAGDRHCALGTPGVHHEVQNPHQEVIYI